MSDVTEEFTLDFASIFITSVHMHATSCFYLPLKQTITFLSKFKHFKNMIHEYYMNK